MTRRMDDTDFMHSVLADGEWHGQMEIINRSVEERGYGLTPHSRASSLRERGFIVENRQDVVNGRRVSEYRLAVRKAEGNSGTADGALRPLGPPAERPAPPGPDSPFPLSVEGPAQLTVWSA